MCCLSCVSGFNVNCSHLETHISNYSNITWMHYKCQCQQSVTQFGYLCVFRRVFFKLNFHEVTFFWCNPAVRQIDNKPTENNHQLNHGFHRKKGKINLNSCLKKVHVLCANLFKRLNVALMQVFSNHFSHKSDPSVNISLYIFINVCITLLQIKTDL